MCELRRSHPRWGPARLAFELGKRDITPVPSEATLYRVLVRNGLIAPGQRRRPASSYIRWERGEPMELWQLDIMGGVFLSDGTEVKLVSGIDDHSRYCVIAQLVTRATGRAVCAAFAAPWPGSVIPAEVLSDNGKQFTGRFTRPRPSRGAVRADLPGERHHYPADPPPHPHHDREDRTLAQDPARGIPRHLRQLRQPGSRPGRAGRLGRLLQPRAAAPVAGHGHPGQPLHRQGGIRWAAAGRRCRCGCHPRSPPHPVQPADPPPAVVPARDADAVEIDRVVPASGNMFAAGRQIWLGKALAGQKVTLRLDHTSLHVFHDGQLIKTYPVTLADTDLARLRATGGRPARPSPATALPPGPLPADAIVEVQRLVGAGGCVGVGGKQVSAGIHLAGQRVTLRIDAKLIQIITADGVLARTLPSPLPPAARGRLHGARLAGPAPAPVTQALHVTRVVSSQGGLMVAGVKIHLGHVHRGKVVTVVIEDSQFRVLHDGTQLAACPRTVIKEVTRRSASGHPGYPGLGGRRARTRS